MTWTKIKFWTKWSIIGLILLYVLLLLAWNRQEVSFYFFFTDSSRLTGAVWLVMLVSFLFGALATLILGWMLRGYFAMQRKRDVRAARTLDDEISEMNRKAQMLQQRPGAVAVPDKPTDPPPAAQI